MVANNQIEFYLLLVIAFTGVIVYSSLECQNYFQYYISKLNEKLYDCESDNLNLFINTLQE